MPLIVGVWTVRQSPASSPSARAGDTAVAARAAASKADTRSYFVAFPGSQHSRRDSVHEQIATSLWRRLW